jgi:hypothetical protein
MIKLWSANFMRLFWSGSTAQEKKILVSTFLFTNELNVEYPVHGRYLSKHLCHPVHFSLSPELLSTTICSSDIPTCYLI